MLLIVLLLLLLLLLLVGGGVRVQVCVVSTRPCVSSNVSSAGVVGGPSTGVGEGVRGVEVALRAIVALGMKLTLEWGVRWGWEAPDRIMACCQERALE